MKRRDIDYVKMANEFRAYLFKDNGILTAACSCLPKSSEKMLSLPVIVLYFRIFFPVLHDAIMKVEGLHLRWRSQQKIPKFPIVLGWKLKGK